MLGVTLCQGVRADFQTHSDFEELVVDQGLTLSAVIDTAFHLFPSRP